MNKIFYENEQLSSIYSRVHSSEWELARKLLLKDQKTFFFPPKLPYKISRKRHPHLKHSFIVAPDLSQADGFKLGALSRGALPHEGIISHGGLGIFKTITWQDGHVSGVKIQDNDKTLASCEATFYKLLGYPCFEFTRTLKQRTKDNKNHTPLDTWLHNRTIYHKHYLVLPLFPGTDLFNYLKNHSLSMSEKIHIGIHLAQSLKKLHDLNIIHADIKPENCIYNPKTKEVTIIDFGFSILLKGNESYRLLDQRIGTKGFIAPEIEQRHMILKASDIYSLGKTLLELGFHERYLYRLNMFNHYTQRPTVDTIIRELKLYSQRVQTTHYPQLSTDKPYPSQDSQHGLSLFGFSLEDIQAYKASLPLIKQEIKNASSSEPETSADLSEPISPMTSLSRPLLFQDLNKDLPNQYSETTTKARTTFRPIRFKVIDKKTI